MNGNSDGVKVCGASVSKVSRLLSVTEADLCTALTERVIAARGEVMQKMHTEIEAEYGRDALAKVSCSLNTFLEMESMGYISL